MGIEEIEEQLPNGLHDAVLRKHAVDYAARTLVVDIDVWVGNLESGDATEREHYQPGVLTFEGLEYFVIEPSPEPEAVIEPFSFSAGNPDTEEIKPSVSLPTQREGTFRAYFFVYRLNAFMHICATGVSFEYST